MVLKMENSINPSKSQAVLFSLRKPQIPQPVRFDNKPISWNSSVKYLGVILDKKFSDDIYRLNFNKLTSA
jgi:hypothetical protein